MVTIRKLEQEGRIYYYLEHPVKLNGRVKKYSKYLGREMPVNVEEVKKQFLYEINRSRWSAVSARAEEKMSIINSNLSQSELERFHHNNALQLTTNSLRISGSSITLLELKRLVENSTVPKWRRQGEIMKAKAHYSIARTIFREKPDFSFQLLVDWHWKLFRESRPSVAGVVRSGQSTLSDEDRTAIIRVMEENYGDSINSFYSENAKNMDKVELAGMVHMRLHRANLFLEGNDIIARLAMNCILHSYGFPLLDIEFNERERYEIAIQKSLLQNDDTAFLKWYFLKFTRKIEALI